MALAKQASALPTNKLTVGALIAAAVQEVYPGLVAALVTSPELAAALTGPTVSMLIGALAGIAVGYFVPDRVNVPVL